MLGGSYVLRAPESVGGMLEKVSGCGAGVERMAASATATTACAAAVIPQAAPPRRRQNSAVVASRNPGRAVAAGQPLGLAAVAIHLRDVAASLRLRGRYDGPTSAVLFLERGRYDGPTSSCARPSLKTSPVHILQRRPRPKNRDSITASARSPSHDGSCWSACRLQPALRPAFPPTPTPTPTASVHRRSEVRR